MKIIEVESKEELSQQVRAHISKGYKLKESSSGSFAHMVQKKKPKGDVLIRVRGASTTAVASGKNVVTTRFLKVKSKDDFDQQVHNLIVMGYTKGYLSKGEARDDSTFLVKRRKVQAGFCILWFIIGVIPMIIYIVWAKKSKPLDGVIVRLEEPKETATSE